MYVITIIVLYMWKHNHNTHTCALREKESWICSQYNRLNGDDCVNGPGVWLCKSEVAIAMQKTPQSLSPFCFCTYSSVHCHCDILTKHVIKQILCSLINVIVDCVIILYFIVTTQEIGDHNPVVSTYM